MSTPSSEQAASSRLFHLFGVSPFSLPRIFAILASFVVANTLVVTIDAVIHYRDVLTFAPVQFLLNTVRNSLVSEAIVIAALFLFAMLEESLGRSKSLLAATVASALAHAGNTALIGGGFGRIPMVLIGSALYFLVFALVFLAMSVPRKAFTPLVLSLLAAQATDILLRWIAGLVLPGPPATPSALVVSTIGAVVFSCLFAGLATMTYTPPSPDSAKPVEPESAPSTGTGNGLLPMPQGAPKAVQWTQGVVWEKERSVSAAKVLIVFGLAFLSVVPLGYACVKFETPLPLILWVAAILASAVHLMMSVGPMNMVGNRQLAEYLVPMLEADERILGACVAKRLGMALWMTGVSKQVFLVFTTHRILLISTKLGASWMKGPSAMVRDGQAEKVIQDIHICDWADRNTRFGGMMFPPAMHLSAVKLRCAPMGQNEPASWAMFIRNTKLKQTLVTVFQRCDAV